MGLHRNAGGADLHDPKGKSPTPLDLDINLDQAYKIVDTEDEIYFSISTIAGTQAITLGSTAVNPKLIQAGTGDVGFGTDTPTSPNGNAKVVEIEGASVGLVLHSTNGGGTPYEIQNNSETLKIQYDTTNRMTVDSSGNIGFGADPSSPNGNAKVVEIKDTSVGLVLNSTNGGAAPWEVQNNGGDLKFIYDGAGTPKTAIALDAEGAMRLGSEVATPTTPAAGDGGQVYVKSDGILYYQSDTVAETDLTASGGIADLFADKSPQLGADLDLNGFSINVESTEYINISGGAIKATTGYGVHDEANNEQLLFTKTSSAVDYFNITNSAIGGSSLVATSTAPLFGATGSDTNIDMGLMCKGTGAVTVRANANTGSAAQSGVLRINAESNTQAVNITVPLNDALTSYTLTLPVDDGDSGQVMQSDGSGVLSWVTPSAGGGLTYQNKTATFSAAVDYFYTVDSSGGDVTVNLPAVASSTAKTIDVCHKVIGNDIIFDGNAAETINGAATLTVAGTAYQNITLFCTGSEWLVR